MLKLSAKFDNVYMVEDCTRTGESQSSQQIKLRLHTFQLLSKPKFSLVEKIKTTGSSYMVTQNPAKCIIMNNVILKCIIMNKGRLRKKKTGKNVVFCQTPLGPPPSLAFFQKKKFTPIFFVENCIFNGRNEFYAWSHFKNK